MNDNEQTQVVSGHDIKPPLWRRLVDEWLEDPTAIQPGKLYTRAFMCEKLARKHTDPFIFGDIVQMNRVLEIQRAVLLTERGTDGQGWQVLSISQSLDRTEEWLAACRQRLIRTIHLTGAVQCQDRATDVERQRALRINEKAAIRRCMWDKPKTILRKLGEAGQKLLSD